MNKNKKAIILLSAGLDSLTALSQAKKDFNVVLALTFDYGQKASKKEIAAAQKIAQYYKVKHKVIRLDFLQEITDTALVNKNKKIPVLKNSKQGNLKTAAAVWVPNRNGLFLNIAAAFAEKLKADFLITGFNVEEAKTFPDNSLKFCKSADKFFSFSTMQKIKVKNYFYKKKKKDILKIAIANKAPLEYLWSCYFGDKQYCGKCESCVRLKEALIANGQLEPIAKKYKIYRGLL